MIDFSILKSFTIPSGTVTQIAIDETVVWKLPNVGGPVVLEVEKIVSNTYAGETTYNNEEFILLNIYPKTNGTVNITYGGLTKTITDTSGAKEPNAQQVFFGTFNGVSDSVATPASGMLTIEGDCACFGVGTYATSDKNSNTYCPCVTSIIDFGNNTIITTGAFYNCSKITKVTIPSSIETISYASVSMGQLESGCFENCSNLTEVIIGNGVKKIGNNAFDGCVKLTDVLIPPSVNDISSIAFDSDRDCFLIVDDDNPYYKIDGNCLIDKRENSLINGFANSVIPPYITTIATWAFDVCNALQEITIPSSVNIINNMAFYACTNLEFVTFENPTGWYVSEKSDFSNPISVDVTDPTNNATLFRNTYNSYYFFRQV